MIWPGRIWRTLKYIPFRQLWFLLRNLGQGKPQLRFQATVPIAFCLNVDEADKPITYQDRTFTFLNQSVQFADVIDWNYAQLGKLWIYNLTYFDFLNQPTLTADEGLTLIDAFIQDTDRIQDGLEPYPTSLRIQNWVQFLSRHQIQNSTVNRHLRAQLDWLSCHLEYHLAGNHLLENSFALLLGALYFRDSALFGKASRLLREQLDRQLLADGLHEERSPIYQQVLLYQLLNLVQAMQHNSWLPDPELTRFLRDKAQRMVDGLLAITFRDGCIPMVNDATSGVAPTTAQLRAKANRILLPVNETSAKIRRQSNVDSGYRMFRQERYELFADVGAIGPDHQPGHAHADSLSFILHVDNLPILVDTGTSTYQPGQRRTYERSTAAHNTVVVEGKDSSEVWASFRVGQRAYTTLLMDTETVLRAYHDGYRHQGVLHERTWALEPTQLVITDCLMHSRTKAEFGKKGVAFFHVNAGLSVKQLGNTYWVGPVKIEFRSVNKLTVAVKRCQLANGFHRLLEAQCLEVTFTDCLETALTFTI